MRALVPTLALLLALEGAVLAPAARAADPDPVAPADVTAIQQVIGRQIDAFRRDDAGSAFDLAAPTIQTMFGDAAHFIAMVQRAYPPVYRPRSVAFGPAVMVEGSVVQTVELVGPDGQPQTAIYTMEREPDGNWRISGCMLTASTAVGA